MNYKLKQPEFDKLPKETKKFTTFFFTLCIKRFNTNIVFLVFFLSFNERENCSLPCYIKKKGNTGVRTRILMSFMKFND